MSNLFERLGGEAAIDAAVEMFYARILADAQLAPIFSGIELTRLKQHQRRFLSLVTGGPNAYAGRDLATAHRGIAERHGLHDGHFDAVLGHLRETLHALGVASDASDQTLRIAESVRGAVLGRAASD